MGLAERRAVQRTVASELATAGDAVVAAVRGEIPAYEALTQAQLDEVRAIAGWGLTRVLDLWVDGGSLGAADLARFRGIGAARAADGRPLAAVLRAYRVAGRLTGDLITARGRDLLSVEDVLALFQTWMISIDQLSEALFAGYTAASERLSGDRERALRDLLDDLLAGRHASPAALADRSRELRVTLPAQPFVLVAEPIDPDTAATEAAADEVASGLAPAPTGKQASPPKPPRLDSAARLRNPTAKAGALADPTGPTRYLVTSRERRVVLLMPPGDRATLDGAVAARGWRGCLIAGQPVTQAALAYRLASDALDTAPAHAFDHGGLLTDGDAHILALLAARLPVTPAEVARTVLGPLAEPRHRHLLDGLDAFLAAGTATAAADQLHLHPQTMRYRLRRVRELTGRDPRLPWQRLVLDVARHLVQISASAGPPSPTR